MTMNIANFPISGPKTDPVEDDYWFEAGLLRWQADCKDQIVCNSRTYRGGCLADRFESVARKLAWQANMNRLVAVLGIAPN